MSCLWQTSLSTMQLASSSLSVALAVIAALTKIGIQGLGVKWPNDIYWRGKKLAGILIESSGEAYGKHNVTIGIGLNVNMPAANGREIDQAWTDLHEATGRNISRNKLIALILTELKTYLERFEKSGIESISGQWQEYDILLGKKVEVVQSASRYSGLARGIDQNGALVVETDEGVRQIYGGEVCCRLDSGSIV
jgi:BirA family biotin operon repressor/biotin-[acetyl-CoA-carboxylase] ligase